MSKKDVNPESTWKEFVTKITNIITNSRIAWPFDANKKDSSKWVSFSFDLKKKV